MPAGLTVFFDGGCPLCSREIGHYRGLRPMEPIAWIDVIEQPHSLDCYGLNQRMALAAFHVWDESAGRMYTGASAFVRLWRALPGYRWLAHGIAALRLTPLLDRAYRIFAERHFRKRCREGACGV